MLDFQVTQANFRYGVAEDQEPHQVPPGTLLTAENVVWKKSGRIEKRLGTTALTRSLIGGGILSAAARLLTRGNELCAIDGANLYSYSATLSAWRTVGQVPDVGLTSSTLLDAHVGVGATDLALSSTGLLVHAWLTGDPTDSAATSALSAQVIDRASGTALLQPTQISTSGNRNLRVLIIGTKAFLLTTNGSNVVAYTIDLTTMTVALGGSLRSDSNAISGLDACVIGSNLVIVYSQTAATVLYAYNTSLVQQATATVEAVASGAVSLDGAAGEKLYVAYGTSANLRLAIHDANALTQTTAPQTVEALTGATAIAYAAVARYDSTHAVVLYSYLNAATAESRSSSYQVTSTGTIVTSSARGTWGTYTATRPFMLSGRCYAFLYDYPALSGIGLNVPGINTILVEIAVSSNGSATWVPHRYVGKSEHIIGAQARFPAVANVVSVSATSILAPLSFQSVAPETNSVWRCGVRLVNATVGASLPPDMWRSCAYGQEAYISAGVLSAYDDRACFDYGFTRSPNVVSMAPGAPGSGSMDPGDYLYAHVLEFRSSAGVLHRSPTVTSKATAAAGGSVAETVNGCNVGNKQTLATGFSSAALTTLIALYRSTESGSTYYRETYDPTYNVVTVNGLTDSQTFLDQRTDGNITGGAGSLDVDLNTRPLLYTAGGILDDEQPPAFTTMTLHGQRIWGIDGTGVQAWFSKSFLDDYGTAPGFSTSFRVQFDAPVTALASVDEKLLAFASDRVWAVLGDGPAPNGDNGDFQVTPVQTAVGCSNPRSVVSTADGVMFQSSRGFYMVSRKLEVVFVGGSVQDQLAAFPNVTSAVLVAKRNEVRFTCNTADGSAGAVLIFNYVQQQWSTARYTANGVYGCPFADACIWQGQWTAATPDGFVLQETEGTYLDGTAWVPMTIETAWISAAGPLGYACVDTMSLGGVSKSNHDLSVAVGFDGESTYAQAAVTFLAGSPVTSIGPLEQCSVSIGTRRRCQAIRFKITDATPTNPGTYPVGTGQGVSLDTMGLELGIEKGLRKLPATKKG